MRAKNELSLNGDWKLAVLHDGEFSKMTPPTTYAQVLAAGAIDAVVPGNFEIDLERAGKIGDPFFGSNLLAMARYEDAHVIYARTFQYAPAEDTVPEFVFEGLDTIGDIYLNGKHIARTDNMFIPHYIEACGLKDGENELVVHLRPACLEARQNAVSAGHFALKYNYETLRLRKAPSMFGWDITPRLVSAGIYRPVTLRGRPLDAIKQAYLMTDAVDVRRGTAKLTLFFDVDIGSRPLTDYSLSASGSCGASSFQAESRLWFTAGKIQIDLADARFWWPKGYGSPHLYDVTVSLQKKGQTMDSRTMKVGVRTVKLVRTSLTDELFSGDFHFEINGRRVFVMGTNWVPVDSYHSRDRERIPKIVPLLDDIGCNAIRCWGGNVYEDPALYDACDALGIMVWQDFAMACGVYPIDPEFSAVMREETTVIVRKLRHHASIILWSGDNECDEFMRFDPYDRDPGINRITREVLPDVVRYEDPTRPYLPSSPFVDEKAAQKPNKYLPENHLWGPRDYYKSTFFKDSLCHFASEIGYHGCPSVASLKKFLSPDKLWPWQDNDEWKIHAASPELTQDGPYIYRIELMAKQIKELFGDIPDTLEDFALASQISQAEAKKFFVELFRCGQPDRSGIIWWNLIDGWPQFSDAVVDYYFGKKLAYYYLKQSQQPLLLTFSEPHDWQLRLNAVNNAGEKRSFTYKVTDYDTKAVVLSGEDFCNDQAVHELGCLPYSLGEKKLYVIEWQSGNNAGRNHYLAGNPPFTLAHYRDFLKDVYGSWLETL